MSTRPYKEDAPELSEVEQNSGPMILEFGNDWCGYCQAAQPFIEEATSNSDVIPHIKVADGKGKQLGRAFKVKLWPTLIFLKDGHEICRVVRPENSQEIVDALSKITTGR